MQLFLTRTEDEKFTAIYFENSSFHVLAHIFHFLPHFRIDILPPTSPIEALCGFYLFVDRKYFKIGKFFVLHKVGK
jgi:hypothetical protein